MNKPTMQRRRSVVLTIALVVVLLLGSRPAAAQEKIIHNFVANGRDGNNPDAGLIQDPSGNFYGTTYGGGNSGGGTVFKLSPRSGGGWREKVLYSFQGNGSGGYSPTASVVRDKAGNLYGTTYDGGNNGGVFELSPQSGGGWKETVLYSFRGSIDGGQPFSGVTLDPAGNVYGTTEIGGNAQIGTVFELSPKGGGAWTETVLHSFQGLDGKIPIGGLNFDGAGNLYGTTSEGGTANYGVVFELSPQGGGSWTETVLYSFGANSQDDGGYPVASMIFDSAGDLYGTAAYGGGGGCNETGKGCGAVFELSPKSGGGWTETILHAFQNNNQDGTEPQGGLVRDAAGNLFGTTSAGGTTTGTCYIMAGCGTVFEVKPEGGGVWEERVLHNFLNNGKDGQNPYCTLVLDATGNLYGTAYIGGVHDFGIVFELMSGARFETDSLHGNAR